MNITLIQGDITTIEVDVIVNAANTLLLGGGGVDGAIHRAGGPEIMDECKIIRDRQGGCPVGEAVITNAGKLPVKKVIHTVGPVWKGGESNEEILLSKCYINSLRLAEKYGMKSIAFPNISTGVYHFPKDKAASIAINSVRNYDGPIIEKVVFVCFDLENFHLYRKLIEITT